MIQPQLKLREPGDFEMGKALPKRHSTTCFVIGWVGKWQVGVEGAERQWGKSEDDFRIWQIEKTVENKARSSGAILNILLIESWRPVFY